MVSIYLRMPLIQPLFSMDEIFHSPLPRLSLLPRMSYRVSWQAPLQTQFTVSPASVMKLSEYKEIRALKNEPLSTLIEKFGLDRVCAVFSKERLGQKFEAEFGEIPPAELVKKHDLLTLLLWNQAGIFSNEKLKAFTSALKFSDIYPQHSLAALLDVFGQEGLKEKFAQEFDPLSNAEFLAKFDETTWDQLLKVGLISPERIDKLNAQHKETIRSDTSPFSQLMKIHGLASLSDAFTLAELTEKFNAECEGKTDKEILAEIDLDFLLTPEGKNIVGDRFKNTFKEGVLRIEKEGGVTREIYLCDSFNFVREVTTQRTTENTPENK